MSYFNSNVSLLSFDVLFLPLFFFIFMFCCWHWVRSMERQDSLGWFWKAALGCWWRFPFRLLPYREQKSHLPNQFTNDSDYPPAFGPLTPTFHWSWLRDLVLFIVSPYRHLYLHSVSQHQPTLLTPFFEALIQDHLIHLTSSFSHKLRNHSVCRMGMLCHPLKF